MTESDDTPDGWSVHLAWYRTAAANCYYSIDINHIVMPLWWLDIASSNGVLYSRVRIRIRVSHLNALATPQMVLQYEKK